VWTMLHHARLCCLDLVFDLDGLGTPDHIYLQFTGIFLATCCSTLSRKKSRDLLSDAFFGHAVMAFRVTVSAANPGENSDYAGRKQHRQNREN